MNKNNKRKANIVLIIFAVIFCISRPFKDNFLLGLISNASLAALIGGFADWFGVTAIFGKPLGLNWPKKIFRTDIINENRGKFVNVIVHTVSEDLLSSENLKSKFKDYNFAAILINFFRSKNGDRVLYMLFDEFQEYLKKPKIIKNINDSAYNIVVNVISKIKLSGVIYETLTWFITTDSYDKMLNEVILTVKKHANRAETFNLIEKIYINALNEYENKNIQRKFMSKFLMKNLLDVSPEKAAHLIQDEFMKILENMIIEDDEKRLKLKKYISDFIKRLDTDEELIKKIENYKLKIIYENDALKNNLESILNSYLKDDCKNVQDILSIVKGKKRKILFEILKDKERLISVDSYIKKQIFDLIDSKHDEIGRTIKKNLDKYNNAEITKLMEEKVSDDLQMIRINGSVVGGFVGVLTYISTFWIK
ncbi:MAG: DUF445 family protein [Clostridium sp.]|nr:DUF445 family protein [Clostridium sp.]